MLLYYPQIEDDLIKDYIIVSENGIKIDNKDLNFKEVEFSLGYPERFAKGEFINRTKYYKKRLTEDGAVIIDPLSTEGEKIVIDDLDVLYDEWKKHKIIKTKAKRKKKDASMGLEK